MAIKAKKMAQAQRTISVRFLGEEAQITYRLGGVNPKFWDWMGAHGLERNSVVGALTQLVVSWDVLGDDDQPISISRAAIDAHEVPTPFLRAVYNSILEDAQPGKLQGEMSSAG